MCTDIICFNYFCSMLWRLRWPFKPKGIQR
ncbi:hypothetical protein D0T53_11970 [Dysgonomonas sp. 216]|nr:hypothetical protein [Dysgonomonas sp. 216]